MVEDTCQNGDDSFTIFGEGEILVKSPRDEGGFAKQIVGNMMNDAIEQLGCETKRGKMF